MNMNIIIISGFAGQPRRTSDWPVVRAVVHRSGRRLRGRVGAERGPDRGGLYIGEGIDALECASSLSQADPKMIQRLMRHASFATSMGDVQDRRKLAPVALPADTNMEQFMGTLAAFPEDLRNGPLFLRVE